MTASDTAVVYDAAVEQKESTIAKDLRLNLKRLLEETTLSREDIHLALLAVACAAQYPSLQTYARAKLAELGLPAEQIQEAAESSAIMAMLNTYYRFKHMIQNDEDYRTAGLRMTSLARPALGKERFEMLAFAVSVINGCESCIRSHEAVLRKAGITADQVHDLARLAAVVRGLHFLSLS